MSRFKSILIGAGVLLAVFALAMTTGLIHTPDVIAHVAHFGSLDIGHSLYQGLALATAPVVALASKNPKALALRAEAERLEAELFDPAKTFSKDETETRIGHVIDLRKRADVAARFTVEDELVRRTGLEEGLTRVTAPGAGADDLITTKGQLQQIRARGMKEFGTVGAMVRALVKGTRGTDAQEAVLNDWATLTRTIVGTAADPSGGEFLLPLQQEPSIFRVSNAENGIFSRARRYNVVGRTFRIPYLVQTAATGASGVTTLPISGGIADVSIIGEGGTKTQQEPIFNQRAMTVFKWAAYSEIGDEVLDDDLTGELQSSVLDIIGQQLVNSMDDKMTVSGTGTNEPLAALHANNPSRLTSAARTTAGTLKSDDIFALLSRHTLGPKSYWSISRRTIEPILKMTLGTNTLVTFLSDLRQSPSGLMLLGLPIVMNDFQPTVGTIGDIALINPEFYAVGLRQQVTIDTSEHFKFRNDVTAIRFLARAGGIPIPDGTYAYKAVGTTKVDEHSPFVVVPT